MTVTYGFYNSLAGDRKYNSVQISRLFEGIINDGVFASIGDSLMVDAGVGMTVNVGTGRAWFNNTWTNNDAILPIVLDPSEAVLNRIDSIVLEIGSASDVRVNSIKKIKGTPGSVPVAPTLIQTTGQYQYPLANIYVGTGVASILQANITNKVGTVSCPFVTVVGLDALLPIWEAEFDVWFAALQAQMAGDVAANLQAQITANLNTEIATKTKYGICSTLGSTVAKVAAQTEYTHVAGGITVIKFTNANTATNPTLNINSKGAKAIQCCGSAVVSGQITANMLAALQYDGTYYQLLNPAYPSEKASYMAFCGNVNANMLDAAFGKGNTTRIKGLGLQIAMYAWFKGDSEATYPFTTLIGKNTFSECVSDQASLVEILQNANVLALINASPFAKDVLGTTIAASSALLKLVCMSATYANNLKTILQVYRSTIIATLAAAPGVFAKTTATYTGPAFDGAAVVSGALGTNTIIVPTQFNDLYSADTSGTCQRYIYYGTDAASLVWTNGSAVDADTVIAISTGISMRGVYGSVAGYAQATISYNCDVYTVI